MKWQLTDAVFTISEKRNINICKISFNSSWGNEIFEFGKTCLGSTIFLEYLEKENHSVYSEICGTKCEKCSYSLFLLPNLHEYLLNKNI